MRQFLKKIFFFIITLTLLIGMVHALFEAELYWGNNDYQKKVKQYKKDDFSAVFLGSSRILTGVNPYQFDSLTNEKNKFRLKSYNLATAGTWANESFYLYECFLQDHILSNDVKFVFIEFQNIMAIQPKKIGTDKAIYYQTLNNLSFIYNYAFDEVVLDARNIAAASIVAASHSTAGAENLFSLKKFKRNNTIDSLSAFEPNQRGFLGLSKIKGGKRTITPEALKAYRRNVMQHLRKPSQNYNPSFFKKSIELIETSRQKGIHLIFVLPPVNLTEGMMAVFNAIPNDNKIEVCDPEKFPELYNIDNWVDETHLNETGANFLNQYLSKEFITMTTTLPSIETKLITY